MIGSKISVAVADAKGNKDVSDETAPVAVYEALEILAAEQKGAKTIEATFSEAITALDKLTVSKNGEELKQAYAPKIADDGLSATITLENRITAGTYTVTLTPADADEDPSEATFEGEVAALNSIEFVTDNLIMKDNEYKEGYAYIKGVDQFGDNMSLSSVTVIPGYGHFRSYDATTGKITIGVDDDETNFAIVKEVPVFVTYQNGADTIPANATLKVTTMSYVQDLTFGDIYKADGTVVDDDTNPLMIGDLKSKPYVEILDAEDQYGNKLSAKDLNDQATGNTKVLFVIPDESTTSAYYSTGKFSTITEKDGTVKTILYLAAGGDMPGSMDLIITGASGQSFSKPITVQDDPYIDTLRVNYPTLYEGTDESDALEFTAVDQYGKEIKDLFKFAPKVVNDDTLQFNDANHLTGQVTRITAPDGVNWVVKKDNINKKFTVSIKLDADVEKGQTLVMMATTAGLKVTPTNLTVGQRTNSESIDTTIGGDLKLDPQNQSFNFNKNVRFLSSNGTTMDRVENAKYPIFLGARISTNDGSAAATAMNAATKEEPVFFWSVSLGKEGKVTKNGDNDFTIEPSSANNAFDPTGVITVTDLPLEDADDADQITDGGQYIARKNGTYYVTLYKATQSDNKLNVSVIDKQSFKITYSPAMVDGVIQTGTRYEASIKENRKVYAGNNENGVQDSVTIRVKAYPNIGEPYYVADEFVTVTGSTSKIYNGTREDGNYLKVYADEAGTATFSIYVDEPDEAQGVWTNVTVEADDKQDATKVQKDFDVVAATRGAVGSKVGAHWMDDSRTETEWTGNTVAGHTAAINAQGQLVITNANRLGEDLYLGIKDQHGIVMDDAKYFVDGLDYATFVAGVGTVRAEGTAYTKTTTNTEKHIIEVRSADDKIIAHYTIELGRTVWNYTEPIAENVEVDNWADLKAALADAEAGDEIDIAEDADITAGGALTIPANVTLKVPDGSALDTGNKRVTIDGTLNVVGEWYAENATITNEGNVTGNGHAELTNCTLNGTTGNYTLTDLTLVINGGTINGGTFGGHVELHDAVAIDGAIAFNDAIVESNAVLAISNTVTLAGTTTLDLEGSTVTGTNNIAGADDFAGTITDQGGNAVEVSGEGDFVLIDGDADDADALANEVATFRQNYGSILGLDPANVADWYEASHANIDTALGLFGTDDGDLSAAAQEALETEKGILTELNATATEYERVSTILAAIHITNPTVLDAADYTSATQKDTDTVKIQDDLLKKVKGLVNAAFTGLSSGSTEYDSTKDKYTVTIVDWTPHLTTAGTVTASDTADYKVKITLNGVEKVDDNPTTLTFTDLPAGT